MVTLPMTARRYALRIFLAAAVLSGLVWGMSTFADTATYLYDDLGRLSQVVDGQGNVAIYTYDAVGNLLSISRNTGGVGVVTMGSGVVDMRSRLQWMEQWCLGDWSGWVGAVADSEGIFMIASWAIYLPAVGWTQGARELTTYARRLS